MNHEFLTLLQQQWMSEKEALIYLTTLELWTAPASTIARRTGLKRVTTYSILRDLENKKIAHALKKSWVTYFHVIDPTKLLATIKQQYQLFEEKLPELMAIIQTYTTKPRVQYFEWVIGLKDMYEDLLTSTVPIHAFLWISATDQELLTYLYEEFLPRRVASNISANVLIPADEHSKEYARLDKKSLKETRIVTDPMFELSSEINLYGPGKVAIALFTQEEMSAIVIQSQKLYESLLSIFSVLRNTVDDR